MHVFSSSFLHSTTTTAKMEMLAGFRQRWEYDDPLNGMKPWVDANVAPLFPESWQGSPLITTNLHSILFSLTLYTVMFQLGKLFLLVPYINKTLIKPKDRVDVPIKTVSFIQSVIICILGIPVFGNKYLAKDHIFATTPYSNFYTSMALGYFIWDALICLYYVQYGGIGFVMHGVVSTLVFGIAIHYQFIQYYSAIFLLFECSTPFLNIRWVGLKLKVLSDSVELINNIILILIFFFIRILWGWYQVVRLAIDYWYAKDDPRFTVFGAIVILTCNAVLDILNVYWFSKMMTVAVTTLKQMFGFAKKNKDDDKLKLM